MKSRVRKYFYRTLGLLLAAIAFALLIAYSGIYNVAANRGHPAWMNWLLTLGLRRSVEFYSSSLKPPELDAVAMLPLGAAHFHGGCASCHGAPGKASNPIQQHMLPKPPPLQIEASHWQLKQLFWIAYHGLQFAGMPGWSGTDRQDEVWTMAVFLQELPAMTPEEYHRLARGQVSLPVLSAADLVVQGRPQLSLSACARCHGTHNKPPTSPLIPRLGGQSPAYLQRALWEYRKDQRQSGFMEPVAVELEAEEIAALADFYSKLAVPQHPVSRAFTPELLEQGRQIAVNGDPAHKLPACLSCHGPTRRADVPQLAGQSQMYLEQQLRLWRANGRKQSNHGRLMSVIANRLSDGQIAAVTRYFASQIPENLKPGESLPVNEGGN